MSELEQLKKELITVTVTVDRRLCYGRKMMSELEQLKKELIEAWYVLDATTDALEAARNAWDKVKEIEAKIAELEKDDER